MATLDDYLALLPSEHASQPNFLAMLGVALQPFVEGQNLVASMPQKFDLEQAVGQQLDFVGQWVGLSRDLAFPIPDLYFSFDTPGLGFDEGIWFNSSYPSEGVVTMDDGTYRTMLLAKVAANVWDGSLEDANFRLMDIFGSGVVYVVDNFDMTQEIVVSGTTGVFFEELVTEGYIQLRPAGVELV